MDKEYILSISLHESLIDEEMQKDIEKIKEHFQKRNITMTTEEIIKSTIQIGIKWHVKENLKLLAH